MTNETGWYSEEPNTERGTAIIKITAANTDTLLQAAPHPVGGKLIIKKLNIHSENGAAAVLKIFDKDPGNATIPTRGTAALPLLTYHIGITSDKEVSNNSLPAEFFQAGICLQATQTDIWVSAEFAIDY